MPVPPPPLRAFAKSETSVQELPFQNSVFAKLLGETNPAKTRASVFDGPAPSTSPLCVFISVNSVQALPFQDSTKPNDASEALLPPERSALVAVPFPAPKALPLFNSDTSVQLDPSQVSARVL